MADDDKKQRAADVERKRWLVARNVRRLRHERGWTQQELAERARIDRTHLARFESRGINVSLDVLFCLAQALDVEARSLLTDDDREETDDEAGERPSSD